MNYTIGTIVETNPKHSDLVDSTIYSLVASKTAHFLDGYVLLHIQKPKWCSVWLYHFFIKHFVCLTHFKN